jgi:hypothetical protein
VTDAKVVRPPTFRQMFPAIKTPRRFTPMQVMPFCEHLVTMLNRMMPAQFTLEKHGDWSLSIHVEIKQPTLVVETDGDA